MYLIVIPYVRKAVPPVRWVGVPARDDENSKRETRGFKHVWNWFHQIGGLYAY
jgi:hypothetical protein